jgi:APA family basic amino acid/polyamine antiporter
VALLYVATNALFLLSGPPEALAGRPDVGAAAAALLGGPDAERAVAGIVCLALLTSISVMVLSGPRVLSQMARDGMLPAILGAGGRAPSRAIVFQAGLAIAIVFFSDLAELIATLGFTLGISSAATVGVSAWLREKEGAASVPIPGHPLVPAAFIGFTLWGAVFLAIRSPAEAAVGTAVLLAGVPAYWLARRSEQGPGG